MAILLDDNEFVYEKMYRLLVHKLSAIVQQQSLALRHRSDTYKQSYTYLFNQITDIIEALAETQQQTEDIFIDEAVITDLHNRVSHITQIRTPYKMVSLSEPLEDSSIIEIGDRIKNE